MARFDREGLTAWSIGMVLLLMPFQWLAIMKLAGRSLKPVHIALLVVGLGFLMLRRPLTRLVAVIRSTDYFAFLFVLYVALMMVALLWTSGPISGAIIVIKQAFYFTVFLMLAVTIASVPTDRLSAPVNGATAVGFSLFIATAIVAFAFLGKNLVFEIAAAVLRGDPQFLQFGIYPVLFKLAGGRPAGQDAETFSTNLRNTIVGTFLLYIILLNAFRAGARQARNRRRLLAIGFSLVGAMLVFLSVSRSNILALAIVLAVVVAVKVGAGWRPSMTVVMSGLFGVLLVMLGGLIASQAAAGSAAIFRARFGVAAIESNARLEMIRSAIPAIDDHPIRGSGMATEVAISKDRTPRMHNLFAIAWLEVGLAGLIVAVLFYFAIVLSWFRHIWSVATHPESWVLGMSPHWVAALPVLPLIRIQLSGGGAFTLIEWTCLSFFFGFVARNRIERRHNSPPPASMSPAHLPAPA
jgi:O-antigen ligase